MHRLPLILAAVAILGAVASAVLFLRIGNSKQILELRLADAQARAAKVDADLAAANEQAGVLKSRLADADTRLADADARSASAVRDLALAQEKLAASDARAAGLTRDLAEAYLCHLAEQNVSWSWLASVIAVVIPSQVCGHSQQF
jgi:hypothetical protein